MDIGVFFTSRRIGFLISLERMLEMRIAICDDKALDRALIMDLLQQYLEDRSIRCELTGYEDGVTLICDMEDGLWFDAVFLDIYMRELLGIEVARRLRSLHYDGAIVFLTGTKKFAVDSYEVSAFGYLLKPHSVEKI
ncbi:MAG: response regulator [Lawsonibacter sp.]|nr:response regulator [Lawsonibacter sp.]